MPLVVVEVSLSNEEVWNRYWRCDRIASCFDGAGASNYDERIASGWRDFFAALPNGARLLDLCTGNGAAALLAAQTARANGQTFRIAAVDRADINPASHVSRHREDYAAIIFLRGTPAEALPFPDGGFDAVISQYGIEYSDLARSLPEAARMVIPGGRLRLVVHAADGHVAAAARKSVAEADQLAGAINLIDIARRCFTAVVSAERDLGQGEAGRREAEASLARFREALARTSEAIAQAQDKAMFENSAAVLRHSFEHRRHFELGTLLAKIDDVGGEIAAHRARNAALVAAALDSSGAEALAERLGAMGAGRCDATPLVDDGGKLIGHVVEASF